MEQALVPTSNWLNGNNSAEVNAAYNLATAQAMTVTTGGLNEGTLTTNAVCYWPYYQYVYPAAPCPIKLTLSEIERLRKAAKADKSLKAILAKFTDSIEITVDFE